MLMFEFVAGFLSQAPNPADCGEKRTNSDHDLAQLGPYQQTWRMIQTGGVAANKGVDMNSPAAKFEEIGVGSVTDELKPGTRLLGGQFTIESFLNAGGFGITYLARDSLDRRVVVKECFPSSFCRRSGTIVAPRTRQREDDFRSVVRLFVQEAMTLSRLDHENIVKVHQVFEDNGTAYMAMDYIDGPDLLETVEGTAAALNPEQIRTILGQMLDAVAHVHQQGVLHRDISPDNILLDRHTGRPVLIDFGASRKDVTRKSRALSGLRVVKDGYSPQEFYIGGSLQGPNSDLYALAATFCHLVTGSTPKTSQERLSAIASRQGDPQVPVVGRAKGYPVEFLKAIDKGMSIFPRDRFQSVAEWQAMLRTEVKRRLAAVPGPVQAPIHRPNHAPTQVPMYVAAPVMAPIPAPAATLASGGPVNLSSFEAPAPMVEASDPTAAVKAAMAAAAEEAALIPATDRQASARFERTQRVVPPTQASAPLAELPPKPASRISRNLAVASAAALVLLAGFLSLPGDLIQRLSGTSTVAALSDAPPVAQVSLANGIVLQTVETAHGARAMVFALPEGAVTDLQVGDVLLVYAATGEVIDSAHAAQSLLSREISNGVATFGFAVQRDGKMAVGYIGLADLGKADLEMKDQDLEKKT
jgi:serine/threonine protein kinase